MKTPGIQVRPIINMAGGHEFNQIIFDNVRVPVANVVGEENRGWYVAVTLLDFERSGIDYSAIGTAAAGRSKEVRYRDQAKRPAHASGPLGAQPAGGPVHRVRSSPVDGL